MPELHRGTVHERRRRLSRVPAGGQGEHEKDANSKGFASPALPDRDSQIKDLSAAPRDTTGEMGSVRQKRSNEETRLVWEPVFEELMCEKCMAILYFDFKLNYCPYCHRRIVGREMRRAKAYSTAGIGRIIR